jgi:hypothetical protein
MFLKIIDGKARVLWGSRNGPKMSFIGSPNLPPFLLNPLRKPTHFIILYFPMARDDRFHIQR